jgi:hypothetical protein
LLYIGNYHYFYIYSVFLLAGSVAASIFALGLILRFYFCFFFKFEKKNLVKITSVEYYLFWHFFTTMVFNLVRIISNINFRRSHQSPMDTTPPRIICIPSTGCRNGYNNLAFEVCFNYFYSKSIFIQKANKWTMDYSYFSNRFIMSILAGLYIFLSKSELILSTQFSQFVLFSHLASVSTIHIILLIEED